MFSAEEPDCGTPSLAGLHAAVDDLLSWDATSCTGPELLELLRGLETVRRRLAVVDQRVIAEVEAQGVAASLASCSTADLLRDVLRIAPRDASARLAAARTLGPRRGLGGEPLPELFPAVLAGQTAGVLSPAHAKVITDLLDALPADVDAAHGRAVEAFLVEHAAHLDPVLLAKAAHRLRDTLDPDGTLSTDRDHQRRRDLTLHPHPDGSAHLTGQLTPAATAVWQTVLDPLSTPRPADNGERDERTAAQRRHDALLEAGQRLLRTADLPDAGGVPVTVQVTLTAEQLIQQTGYATTSHGGAISIPQLLQLATEADIIPVVLNQAGGILGYGRTRRLASPAQRQALAARDRGCSFPNCDRPPTWCQAHHIVPWIEGGNTDLANLTLLCGYHHREFDKRGWTCVMTDGLPHWKPPPWIDPDQTPRRNHTHHPTPELV